MNHHVEMYLKDMKYTGESLMKLCRVVVTKHDGHIDPADLQTVERIDELTKHYLAELDKLQ